MLAKTIKRFFTNLLKKPQPIGAEIPDSAPLGLQIQFAKRQTNISY